MINSLIKQLASQTTNELTQKANIPENLVGDILNLTGQVATKEVANQVTQNGIDNLMNLFSNKPNNSSADSIQNNLVNGLISSFTQKLGLSQEQATMASDIIVPILLNMITKENEKTPDNDPSPIQQIFEIGGNAKGAKNALGGLLGKFLKG